MDAKHMCDKELLVSYLYDEIDPASRRAIETHLASCPACREEAGGLRATRRQLADWAPPEYQLGFQIVSRPSPPARASRLPVLAGMGPGRRRSAGAGRGRRDRQHRSALRRRRDDGSDGMGSARPSADPRQVRGRPGRPANARRTRSTSPPVSRPSNAVSPSSNPPRRRHP